MEYSPNFFSEGMQEHDIQAATSSLPYANMISVDEQMQGCMSYLPQGLAMAMPYSVGHVMAHEEGFNCSTMHAVAEELPKMHDYEPQYSHLYTEPNMVCMTPVSSSPLCSHITEPLNMAPDYLLDDQAGHYLLALQSLLKSQYGISLTVDQLLAFDALPALLQPEHEQQQGHTDLEVMKQNPPFDHHNGYPQHASLSHLNMYQHFQVNQAVNADIGHQSSSLAVHTNQDAIPCVSPISYKRLSVHEPYKAQDISSPGSAASSSVVTDSENNNTENGLQQAECIGVSNIRNLALAANVSQSWSNPSISWVPGGGDESGVLQALRAMEVVEPAAQRRRLQGITLEQVLQAEKLQQNMNAEEETRARSNFSAFKKHIHADEEMQIRPHELQLPQPKRPAATSVEPQSIAARHRRKRIREKTESLGMIIPGATRLDTATMFDLAIKYVHFLQAQMVCLENEVSFIGTSSSQTRPQSSYEEETVSGFRRALIHRLLSSQDVQHFLSREGLCLVTESLASRLNFDPNSSSVFAMRAARPQPTAPAAAGPPAAATLDVRPII